MTETQEEKNEIIRKILSLHSEGKTIFDIADLLDLSPVFIKRVIAEEAKWQALNKQTEGQPRVLN
jgi:hypothetical protein